MKALIRQVLTKVGAVQPVQPETPYEYLWSAPRYKEVTVKLLGEDFRVADPRSFYWNYREIFMQEIYKFESQNSSPLIIDCGANYGTSIVYFNKIFPQARIIGVEADPGIFEILKSNITSRRIEQVRLLNKAVSSARHSVKFYSEGADGGRLHYHDDAQKTFEVEAINLDDLIEGDVDFLKVDIEGAETQVICSCDKLDRVGQLFIEYHSFKDSSQTLADILRKLTEHRFRYYIHTEFCSPQPLTLERLQGGMDLQLNIFARRNN